MAAMHARSVNCVVREGLPEPLSTRVKQTEILSYNGLGELALLKTSLVAWECHITTIRVVSRPSVCSSTQVSVAAKHLNRMGNRP